MTTRPRRPWFSLSFGLRTLFVLVTVLALPGAWVAMERRQSAREVQIAKNLREAGWELELGGPFDSYPPFGPVESQGSWRSLSRQLLGQRVYKARAPQPNSTNTRFHVTTNVSAVAELTNLRELDIDNSQVRDLAPLARLKKLEVLGFENTSVTDLTPLSKLTNLHYLFIRQSQVYDLSPLAGLSDLCCLYLSGTPVSDLRPVADKTKLFRLYFDGCPVSDEQQTMIREALPKCRF